MPMSLSNESSLERGKAGRREGKHEVLPGVGFVLPFAPVCLARPLLKNSSKEMSMCMMYPVLGRLIWCLIATVIRLVQSVSNDFSSIVYSPTNTFLRKRIRNINMVRYEEGIRM